MELSKRKTDILERTGRVHRSDTGKHIGEKRKKDLRTGYSVGLTGIISFSTHQTGEWALVAMARCPILAP